MKAEREPLFPTAGLFTRTSLQHLLGPPLHPPLIIMSALVPDLSLTAGRLQNRNAGQVAGRRAAGPLVLVWEEREATQQSISGPITFLATPLILPPACTATATLLPNGYIGMVITAAAEFGIQTVT